MQYYKYIIYKYTKGASFINALRINERSLIIHPSISNQHLNHYNCDRGNVLVLQPGCRQASSVYTPRQADDEQQHIHAAPLSCGWNCCFWSWISRKNIVCSAVQTLTLSLAMDANLLAPTAKLLQPWKSGRQKVRKTKHIVPMIEEISTYRVNRRHGIVDEVVLFFFRCHGVPKTNITVLLIPTVASSTVPVQTHLN